MAYDMERRVALESVRRACRLCQEVRATLVSEETLAKKDRSPVTVADYGAQAMICRQLAAAFPEDPIVAEEDSSDLTQPENREILNKVLEHTRRIEPDISEQALITAIDRGRHRGGPQGRFWTLDPIDGTQGFLRGDQYAVALALVVEGQVMLGVLGCPNLPLDPKLPDGPRGVLFAAVRGQGAVMRLLADQTFEQEIAVDEIGNPRRMKFCEPFESGHTSHSDAGRVAELLGVTAPPLRMDSQAKYAAVARGDASIYLRLPASGSGSTGPERYVEKIWDHAAGTVIIEEAGGRVSDLYGRPLEFSTGRTLLNNVGVIATNGRLHDRVLEAVQAVAQAPGRIEQPGEG